MEVSYNLILIFQVCLARPSQSTHDTSVWLSLMQQYVAILNYGRSDDFSNSCKRIDYFSEASLN